MEPPQAVADDGDRPVLAEPVLGGGRVAHEGVEVRIGDEFPGLLDLFLAVAGFEAGLGAVEEGGCQRHVAGVGEPVAHLADVLVHAEDLLDDNTPPLTGSPEGRAR